MTNKDLYKEFESKTYIPIFSKSWWLDAVCGEDKWDVWIYQKGNDILAAMPYYIEQRGKYTYITKAKLTQNNGIIFKYPKEQKLSTKQKYEEEIIDCACEYIKSLNVDVYEQQYHYSFENWLPFFWNRYKQNTRYTYVIESNNESEIWDNISSKYRNKIKNGILKSKIVVSSDPIEFYILHKKVFNRQGLECPFSEELWIKLYNYCKLNNSGEAFYAIDNDNNVTSLIFLVWDEKSMYQILGGTIPEYQSLGTYDALIWYGIQQACSKKIKYDFEGSVIKRIAKSFREFGGRPVPYFRIRKIFNDEIILNEAYEEINDKRY